MNAGMYLDVLLFPNAENVFLLTNAETNVILILPYGTMFGTMEVV